MTFARQISQRVLPNLERFVGTDRQKKDPCFHCTLWDCTPGKQCEFIQTSFPPNTALWRERKALLEDLQAQGEIEVTANGRIRYDLEETDIERTRRQKREHMQRKRSAARTATA